MRYPISACCFIRNTFTGGFCLPESMAQFMPFVDEMVIMDLGSTDGTVEFLQDIADHNPKVKLILEHNFPFTDANVFAHLANDLVDFCHNPHIIYWQSDEIWHHDLLRLMAKKFEAGKFDLSFWRIQYANNFQYVKWFPHLVHRVGTKGDDFNEGKRNFEFNGDGMNTTRSWDAAICSNYGGEMFPKWGDLGQQGIKDFTNEMITDVSLLGAFRDLIPDRRRMHAPFWHEEPTIPYYNKNNGQQPHMVESEWYAKALGDEDWTKTQSPYSLPKLLQWHVGKTRYELQPGLVEALRSGNTNELIGL
jgi:glycosyltransferase involved in cell wall biosynthesis